MKTDALDVLTPVLRSTLRRRRAGMTLVEIVLVIAIIGILMAVVGGSLIGVYDDAQVEATKLTMGKIDQGLQLYAVKHKGKFPSTAEGLSAAAKNMADQKVPTDAWGNEFQYFSPGSNSSAPYELISLGKDGQEGGDDANADIQSWNLDGEE